VKFCTQRPFQQLLWPFCPWVIGKPQREVTVLDYRRRLILSWLAKCHYICIGYTVLCIPGNWQIYGTSAEAAHHLQVWAAGVPFHLKYSNKKTGYHTISAKFVSFRPDNNLSWTYVIDFFFNRRNLWDTVKKSAKLYTGKKSAKKCRLTSSRQRFLAKLLQSPKRAKNYNYVYLKR
jgi:hypothetical protein